MAFKLSEADKAAIWDVLMQKLRDSRDAMIDIMNRFPEEEAALREMERVFHSHVDKKEQPDEAFYINAASMMKTLKRQFPERFPRHFQLIAQWIEIKMAIRADADGDPGGIRNYSGRKRWKNQWDGL